MDYVASMLSNYGYVGLFTLLVVGVFFPIPGEALLTFAGYLCARGELDYRLAILVSFFGTACGITISYGVGRVLGEQSLRTLGSIMHLEANRIQSMHNWMRHRGLYVLPVAYFVPAIRHLAAIFAGVSGASISLFAIYAYPGAILWSVTFITIGYSLGSEWEQLSPAIHRNVWLVAVVMIITCIMIMIRWRHRHP